MSRPYIPPEPKIIQPPKRILCPNCNSEYYSVYANGTWREGYCQNCGYESKESSKDIENLKKVNVSKPKPKPSKKDW